MDSTRRSVAGIADPDAHVLNLALLIERVGEEMHNHHYAAAAATSAELLETWRLLDLHLCAGGQMPARWSAE